LSATQKDESPTYISATTFQKQGRRVLQKKRNFLHFLENFQINTVAKDLLCILPNLKLI
jgi:hypothetical protein